MTERRLWWQLLRIGVAAGRGAQSSRVRLTALLCATLVLTVSLGALVAGFATYDGRDLRGKARAPQYVQEGSGQKPVALWRGLFDTVGNIQHSIVLVEPLTSDAPLPPGLSHWPQPGQAAVSPALADALDAAGDHDRYGETTERIAPEGLAVPRERLAYVRPAAHLGKPPFMQPIAGFGRDDAPAAVGDNLWVQPLSTFAPAVIGLVLAPAAVLVVIAARIGSAGRDRRTALLQAMGAAGSSRAWVNIGEALLPVLAGAGLGALAVAIPLFGDLRIPVVDFRLAAIDLHRWGWVLAAAVAAAVVAVLTAVVLLQPKGAANGATRPKAAKGAATRRMAVLCPLMLLWAVRGTDFIGNAFAPLYLLIYTTGVIGTLVTLPAVVALTVAGAGRILARLARRLGSPGMLVAGRWAATSPGTVTRMVATVIVAIGLVAQVQLWSSRLNPDMQAATTTHSRIGNQLVTATGPFTSQRAADFVAAVERISPGKTQVLGLTPGQGGVPTLTGACPAITPLGLTCGDKQRTVRASDGTPAFQELMRWYGQGTDKATVRPQATTVAKGQSPTLLIAVSTDGSDLPVEKIRHLAHAELAVAPDVDVPGGEWLKGAAPQERMAAWVMFLGIIGVLFLAIGAALNNLSDFLGFASTVAPISVLTGRRTVFYSVAAWTILIPFLLAGGLGALTAVWLGSPLTRPGGGAQMSWPVLGSGLAVVEALAVLFWLWAASTSSRTAGRWRPRAD
ncbi:MULTISPECIES: hypothetical protein [Streptomyces]|uniref:hypothetical protein n=1 Tax=Streptomyces TaxID=1883 RepID=UPI0004CDC470|nr:MULTISPECIES: hypothetical protein [Streptomyces]KOT62125.1 hypothetical protein ADK43_11380 [Streptomyces rimosus subsp. rimosus]